MGFFKRIRREISRTGRRVEKQIKRTPAVQEALDVAKGIEQGFTSEFVRTIGRVEKGFIRELPKVARVAGIIAPLFGIPGLLLGGGTATAIQIFAARRARKKFEKSQQLQAERIQRERGQVPLGSFLSGLAGPGGFQSLFTSVLGGIGKVAVPILEQAGQQFVQKQIRSIVGTPRAPTAAFVAQTAPFRGGGPSFPFPLPSPQVPQRRIEQVRFPPMAVNGTRPGVTMGRGGFFGIPDFPQQGGKRLVAVLLPDGSVGHFVPPKRRRMNVLNPRALSRAIRRVDGFAKSVMRSRKALKRIKSV